MHDVLPVYRGESREERFNEVLSLVLVPDA